MINLQNYTTQQQQGIKEIEYIFIKNQTLTKKDYVTALNFLRLKYK